VHELTVDAARSLGPNTRFWQAVGEDALYFLTPLPQGQYLLDRLGKTGAVKVMRNHYALSDANNHGVNCGGEAYREDADGKPVYNFAKMNAVYAEWLKRGIRPVVELDYMP
jgi:xylan 1,4-beta-xylosidase